MHVEKTENVHLQVTYERLNPHQDGIDLSDLIECYQTVFQAPPWNEWKKCTVCDQHWGIGAQKELELLGYQHCSKPVVDYWPTPEVETNLKDAIKPGASCWIARMGSKIVGFTWGMPMTPKEIAEYVEFSGFDRILEETFGSDVKFGYQSELGVVNGLRRLGIGRGLVTRRHGDFIEQGIEVGVIRTMSDPPSVTYSWYNKVGFKVLAEYGDVRKRVILGRLLHQLKY